MGEPAAPAYDYDESTYDAKLIKTVRKEGGKRGAEIAGAADMGGMSFMNVSVDEPSADAGLLLMSLEEMDRPIDPANAEEVKGGSGHVGKCLFSYGKDKVGILANVPAELADKVDAKVWMEEIVKPLKGEILDKASSAIAQGEVDGDADKDLYPIKIKDEALQNSIKYLQKIGVFPEGNDEDSDYMVFGDDDFPCDNE